MNILTEYCECYFKTGVNFLFVFKVESLFKKFNTGTISPGIGIFSIFESSGLVVCLYISSPRSSKIELFTSVYTLLTIQQFK